MKTGQEKINIRLEIIRCLLNKRPFTVTELAAAVGVSRTAIAKELKVLIKECKVLRIHKNKTYMINTKMGFIILLFNHRCVSLSTYFLDDTKPFKADINYLFEKTYDENINSIVSSIIDHSTMVNLMFQSSPLCVMYDRRPADDSKMFTKSIVALDRNELIAKLILQTYGPEPTLYTEFSSGYSLLCTNGKAVGHAKGAEPRNITAAINAGKEYFALKRAIVERDIFGIPYYPTAIRDVDILYSKREHGIFFYEHELIARAIYNMK